MKKQDIIKILNEVIENNKTDFECSAKINGMNIWFENYKIEPYLETEDLYLFSKGQLAAAIHIEDIKEIYYIKIDFIK